MSNLAALRRGVASVFHLRYGPPLHLTQSGLEGAIVEDVVNRLRQPTHQLTQTADHLAYERVRSRSIWRDSPIHPYPRVVGCGAVGLLRMDRGRSEQDFYGRVR